MLLRLSSALRGEEPRATRKLLRHGLFWLAFSIFLDYFTSWIMMSSLGPNAEGNMPTRLFFENKDYESMINLVASQWPWIFFLGLGFIALAIASLASHNKDNRMSTLAVFYPLGIGLTWIMAALRLILGPSSNLSSLLVFRGEVVAELGYYLIALAGAIIIATDFALIILEKGDVDRLRQAVPQ